MNFLKYTLFSFSIFLSATVMAQDAVSPDAPAADTSSEEKKESGGLRSAVGSAIGDVKGGVGGGVGSVAGSIGAGTLGSVGGIVTGGLNSSIDDAVRVAEEYPANVQTHILNDDHVTTVVLSIERVANQVENLPDLIADAVVKVLNETGEQQPEIRETLKVVNDNLGTVDLIVGSSTQLTEEASKVADNATPLMRELVELMEELNEGSRLALEKAEIEKDKPQPEPVDLKEVNTLIESSTATVAELRQTVEQLRMMTDEGSIEESTILIGDEVENLVKASAGSVSGIIYSFFIGLIAFILTWYGASAALAWYRLKLEKDRLETVGKE